MLVRPQQEPGVAPPLPLPPLSDPSAAPTTCWRQLLQLTGSRGDSNRGSTHGGSTGDNMGGKSNSGSGAKATHSSGSPGLRLEAAVEARLERKRLLEMGIKALQRYLRLAA